jgi:hypothetical protein
MATTRHAIIGVLIILFTSAAFGDDATARLGAFAPFMQYGLLASRARLDDLYRQRGELQGQIRELSRQMGTGSPGAWTLISLGQQRAKLQRQLDAVNVQIAQEEAQIRASTGSLNRNGSAYGSRTDGMDPRMLMLAAAGGLAVAGAVAGAGLALGASNPPSHGATTLAIAGSNALAQSHAQMVSQQIALQTALSQVAAGGTGKATGPLLSSEIVDLSTLRIPLH